MDATIIMKSRSLLSALVLVTCRCRCLAKEDRIMGGSDAAAHRYPFFAHWPDMGCGASLIAPDLILSAAHCYGNDGEGMGRIWVNSIHVERGNAYDVVQVWHHPQFNGDFDREPEYDFLIARLNESIPAGIATPVVLNRNASVPSVTGETLVIIGFGSLDEEEREYPDTLQQVEIPYLETEPDCQLAWDGAVNDNVELCTVHPQGGMDSCFGDSGGPILTLPDLHQVGLVSWGQGCGRPEAPSVQARVSAVADSWIRPLVCRKSSAPPLAMSCHDLSLDLPLSLRLELTSSPTAAWETLNLSFGLYQVSPPKTLYEVENGVTIMDSRPPTTMETAITRRKKDKDEEEQDGNNEPDEEAVALADDNWEEAEDDERGEEDRQDVTSLFFPNLAQGLYYFRISQKIPDLLNLGTFHHLRLVQGGPNSNGADDENVFAMERAWVDLYGAAFDGFNDQYIDLKPKFATPNMTPPVMPQPQQEVLPPVKLVIDIFYDNAPTETAWEILDRSTNSIVFAAPVGSRTEPGLSTHTVEVSAGSMLEFRIWDSAGDGICCTKGEGWVELWAGFNQAWLFDGVFQDEFSLELQL